MNVDFNGFVGKLRQTVSQVAYQVNNSVNTIIPGNPIHRDYEVLRLRCTYGSPGLYWSVYDGIKRESASIKASIKDAIGPNIPAKLGQQLPDPKEINQVVDKKLYSVFVFDKTQLDKLANRSEREIALEHIKQGVTQLTRLRHPAVLTVHHPIEESRSSLAFVTEHVYGHLASILKEQRSGRVKSKGITSSTSSDLVDLSNDLGPKDSDYQSDSCQLDAVQIKAGLLQVCDGLKFLHNSAKILHRNLCLENIFVDSNNTWKISGFDFCCQPSENQSNSNVSSGMDLISTQESSPFEFNSVKRIDSQLFSSLKSTMASLPSSVAPNWSCSAPEHSNFDHVTFASDIFSLGIISCALLGNESDMIDLSYEYGLISDTYKRGLHFRELSEKLPASYKTSIMKYAAINANTRPTLDDFENLAIFNDEQVKAIRDLDSQLTWDRLRKIDFFNMLRDLLPRLSHQVKINRIAKSLFNEVINLEMVPYVLPCILIIAKDSTPTEFKTKIFPHLKGPFRILEPRSVPIMLLDNMTILADRAKLCLSEFQQSAFTLIQYLLRMDEQMQQKSLSIIPNVLKYIDINSMNTMILPEIDQLYHKTTTLSIRIKCLECLGNMVDAMDKSAILDKVFAIIFQLPSNEISVIMATVGVIKNIVMEPKIQLDKTIIACKILPFLLPLSVERELNLQQFDVLFSLIKKLMDQVEREQRQLLGKKDSASSSLKSSALSLNNPKKPNYLLID